ncbi:hypothetical protein AB6A40_006957 [Gnathostoma spinigerum]|uniref:ShKT domain-containing protein n=1 Tax=Gnathostoma spinigerum TaxID=75299 RepID=A0ABD6ET78_9BILA
MVLRTTTEESVFSAALFDREGTAAEGRIHRIPNVVGSRKVEIPDVVDQVAEEQDDLIADAIHKVDDDEVFFNEGLENAADRDHEDVARDVSDDIIQPEVAEIEKIIGDDRLLDQQEKAKAEKLLAAGAETLSAGEMNTESKTKDSVDGARDISDDIIQPSEAELEREINGENFISGQELSKEAEPFVVDSSIVDELRGTSTDLVHGIKESATETADKMKYLTEDVVRFASNASSVASDGVTSIIQSFTKNLKDSGRKPLNRIKGELEDLLTDLKETVKVNEVGGTANSAKNTSKDTINKEDSISTLGGTKSLPNSSNVKVLDTANGVAHRIKDISEKASDSESVVDKTLFERTQNATENITEISGSAVEDDPSALKEDAKTVVSRVKESDNEGVENADEVVVSTTQKTSDIAVNAAGDAAASALNTVAKTVDSVRSRLENAADQLRTSTEGVLSSTGSTTPAVGDGVHTTSDIDRAKMGLTTATLVVAKNVVGTKTKAIAKNTSDLSNRKRGDSQDTTENATSIANGELDGVENTFEISGDAADTAFGSVLDSIHDSVKETEDVHGNIADSEKAAEVGANENAVGSANVAADDVKGSERSALSDLKDIASKTDNNSRDAIGDVANVVNDAMNSSMHSAKESVASLVDGVQRPLMMAVNRSGAVSAVGDMSGEDRDGVVSETEVTRVAVEETSTDTIVKARNGNTASNTEIIKDAGTAVIEEGLGEDDTAREDESDTSQVRKTGEGEAVNSDEIKIVTSTENMSGVVTDGAQKQLDELPHVGQNIVDKVSGRLGTEPDNVRDIEREMKVAAGSINDEAREIAKDDALRGSDLNALQQDQKLYEKTYNVQRRPPANRAEYNGEYNVGRSLVEGEAGHKAIIDRDQGSNHRMEPSIQRPQLTVLPTTPQQTTEELLYKQRPHPAANQGFRLVPSQAFRPVSNIQQPPANRVPPNLVGDAHTENHSPNRNSVGGQLHAGQSSSNVETGFISPNQKQQTQNSGGFNEQSGIQRGRTEVPFSDIEVCDDLDPNVDVKCCDLREQCKLMGTYCRNPNYQLWYFCPQTCGLCKKGTPFRRPSRYERYQFP